MGPLGVDTAKLWMPEVGGRVDWHAEDHEDTMVALGLSSKREITRTRVRVMAAMAAQTSVSVAVSRLDLDQVVDSWRYVQIGDGNQSAALEIRRLQPAVEIGSIPTVMGDKITITKAILPALEHGSVPGANPLTTARPTGQGCLDIGWP